MKEVELDEIRALSAEVMAQVIRRGDLKPGPIVDEFLFETVYDVGRGCTVTVEDDGDGEWGGIFLHGGRRLTGNACYRSSDLPTILAQWQAEEATAWPRSHEYARACVRLAHHTPVLLTEVDRLRAELEKTHVESMLRELELRVTKAELERCRASLDAARQEEGRLSVELEEARATLLNERGEGPPPSEGWTWEDTAPPRWRHPSGYVITRHTHCAGWTVSGPGGNRAVSTAREGMKLVDGGAR